MDEETYYEYVSFKNPISIFIVSNAIFYCRAEPHYGWADVVGNSSQLLSIEPRERPPGVYPEVGFGLSDPPQLEDSPGDSSS